MLPASWRRWRGPDHGHRPRDSPGRNGDSGRGVRRVPRHARHRPAPLRRRKRGADRAPCPAPTSTGCCPARTPPCGTRSSGQCCTRPPCAPPRCCASTSRTSTCEPATEGHPQGQRGRRGHLADAHDPAAAKGRKSGPLFLTDRKARVALSPGDVDRIAGRPACATGGRLRSSKRPPLASTAARGRSTSSATPCSPTTPRTARPRRC
jgi:hypothetical protein